MDSDSRHSIYLLYIPWGKIWSTCSKPFTEETTVHYTMTHSQLKYTFMGQALRKLVKGVFTNLNFGFSFS